MLVDLGLCLFAVVALIQLGLLVDYYLVNNRQLKFKITVFLALGIGTVAISQMIWGLFNLKIGRELTILASLGFFVPMLIDQKLARSLVARVGGLVGDAKTIKSPLPFLLLILIVPVTIATFVHTPWGDDAYERWLAKANYFFVDGQISKQNLYLAEPNDDPVLWPLTASWLYHILGKSSEFWVQIIPLVVFLLLVVEFWRRLPDQISYKYAWIVILAATPLLWGQVVLPEYSGNADLVLAFYFLLAFGALLGNQIVYAATFFGIAALVKNDALPALVGFIFLLIVGSLLTKTKLQKTALVIAAGFLIFNIAWKVHYGLSNRFVERDIGEVLAQRPFFKYNRYSLQAFREEFRQTHHWALGWMVIAFLVVTRARLVTKNKLILFAFLLFGAQFLGYLWVYYVNSEDQATEIATTIPRLSLALYPSALLVASILSAKGRSSQK